MMMGLDDALHKERSPQEKASTIMAPYARGDEKVVDFLFTISKNILGD